MDGQLARLGFMEDHPILNNSAVQWLTPSIQWDGTDEPPFGLLVAVACFTAIVVPCVLAFLLRPPLVSSPRPLGVTESSRVVLVVAHPDDEAMFFWPTLLRLRDAGVPLSVLCLSTGNADGLGGTRTREMQRSCERLGISGDDLSILDVQELQDGFHSWPEDVVANHVLAFVRARKTNLLLTFDGVGVSGHPNHVSTSKGVLRALNSSRSDIAVARFDVLMLESVPLPLKYLGPLNFWFCNAEAPGNNLDSTICNCVSPVACLRALAMHWSQLVWYRVLFTLFSRYAYVNTYVQCTFAGSPQIGRAHV